MVSLRAADSSDPPGGEPRGPARGISYWMRIGYDVTNSNWARNALKLQYGLRGWIPDGALFRVSTVGVSEAISFEVQDKFIRDLLNAETPETRAFRVGDPARALLSS